VPLTPQPVDEAGRCAGQAERQRHAHQHFVAIDWGWGARRIDPRAQSFQFMRQEKRVEGALFPISGEFRPIWCCFGPLTPSASAGPSAES